MKKYKPWILAVFALSVLTILLGEPQLSKKTEWRSYSSEGFCEIVARNSGVELRVWLFSSVDRHNLTGIQLDRPSRLNDMLHSEIYWPSPNNFGNEVEDNDVWAGFFSYPALRKVSLPIIHQGGGDNAIGTTGPDERTATLRFAENLVRYQKVEIYKRFLVNVGAKTVRLGKWEASSPSDVQIIDDFSTCLAKL